MHYYDFNVVGWNYDFLKPKPNDTEIGAHGLLIYVLFTKWRIKCY